MTVSETEPPLPAEDDGGDPGDPGDSSQPRRYPSTLGGALYLVALAVVVAGVAIAVFDDWRNGVRWIGGALLFAAGCRLLVPRGQAGMLAVRNRWIDVVLLAGVGGGLLFLAGSIPDQPF